MDEIIILVLFIWFILSIIAMSELHKKIQDDEEKISMLEFEKREAYLRGCQEGRKYHADE